MLLFSNLYKYFFIFVKFIWKIIKSNIVKIYKSRSNLYLTEIRIIYQDETFTTKKFKKNIFIKKEKIRETNFTTKKIKEDIFIEKGMK